MTEWVILYDELKKYYERGFYDPLFYGSFFNKVIDLLNTTESCKALDILIDFVASNNLNVEFFIRDHTLFRNIIEQFKTYNVHFTIENLYKPKNNDFFKDIKNYETRALILDIVCDVYNMKTKINDIFYNIKSQHWNINLDKIERFGEEHISLMFFKLNSKILVDKNLSKL